MILTVSSMRATGVLGFLINSKHYLNKEVILLSDDLQRYQKNGSPFDIVLLRITNHTLKALAAKGDDRYFMEPSRLTCLNYLLICCFSNLTLTRSILFREKKNFSSFFWKKIGFIECFYFHRRLHECFLDLYTYRGVDYISLDF